MVNKGSASKNTWGNRICEAIKMKWESNIARYCLAYSACKVCMLLYIGSNDIEKDPHEQIS